jgi:hypothetical protein
MVLLEVYCTHEGEEKCCRVLVGKPEGNRPLGRPRCRWMSNIRMDIKEIGWRAGHKLD